VGHSANDATSCPAAVDTGSFTVTGPAPGPTSLSIHTPSGDIQPGDTSDSVTINGSGFAYGDQVSFSQAGTPVPGISFTRNPSGLGMSGTLNVAGDVPTGAYDVTLTDSEDTPKHGTAVAALVIGGNLKITDLTPTPLSSTTARASWTQVPPPANFTVTGYEFIVTTDDDPIDDHVQPDPTVTVSQSSPTATTHRSAGCTRARGITSR
jgi:hypothetical protein